jgi:hypothetical protein
LSPGREQTSTLDDFSPVETGTTAAAGMPVAAPGSSGSSIVETKILAQSAVSFTESPPPHPPPSEAILAKRTSRGN